MADTTASSPGANCMEKLKSYVKTQKGFILAAEIFISLIVLICYAASLYGGYSAVAICEMIFAIVFFGIFMMELDKQIQVVNWVWSVSALHVLRHTQTRACSNIRACSYTTLHPASSFSTGSFPCWHWRCPLHHHLSDLCHWRSRGRRSYCRGGQ
uniref:Proteolipid protein 2b n=1 Tax=Lates calcarifer TaxID=8187 RepID=A0A4W6E1V1_LATCA